MMKQAKRFLTIAALVSIYFFHAIPATEAEAAYDLSKYMEWQNGGWVLYQEYEAWYNEFQSTWPEEFSGMIIKKSKRNFWHSPYGDDGDEGNWVPDSKWRYQRTTKYVKMIAINDEGKTWAFDPVIKIPRALKLGKSFIYSGVAKNKNKKINVTFSLTIAKAGFSVNTAAGSFDDCIEVITIMSSGAPDNVEVNIQVMARGIGTVKRWNSELERESDGYEVDAFEVDSEYHEAIDHGVSNPPFP